MNVFVNRCHAPGFPASLCSSGERTSSQCIPISGTVTAESGAPPASVAASTWNGYQYCCAGLFAAIWAYPGALEHALARFRGDFLDGEPVGDWHLEHRDRLQRVYVDALMELGARFVAEERHAKAAEAYRRVLARDELHEEALLALMKSLAAMGERSQALRVYRRFADRMREELDTEPDDETTAFFERLQQGAGV